jgi:hypothetical protein
LLTQDLSDSANEFIYLLTNAYYLLKSITILVYLFLFQVEWAYSLLLGLGGVESHVLPAGSSLLDAHLLGLLSLDDALNVGDVSLFNFNHLLDDFLLLDLDDLQDSLLLGEHLSLDLDVVSLESLGEEFNFIGTASSSSNLLFHVLDLVSPFSHLLLDSLNLSLLHVEAGLSDRVFLHDFLVESFGSLESGVGLLSISDGLVGSFHLGNELLSGS